jgi:hypothetical protein
VILNPMYVHGNGTVSVLLAPLPSDPPTAALAVSPNPVKGGGSVTLDASGSSDPLDRQIVDYRWDLGDGRFDHDTGASPTIIWRYTAPGTVHLRVQVTNSAGETAIASGQLAVRRSPSAVVSGSVQICGGPARRRCRIETFRVCQAARRCFISDRVAAVDSRGRRRAIQRITHGRFRLRLAPGRYTIELLGDGKRVHAKVIRRKRITARANQTLTVRFRFLVP